jgi:uncharacterized protein (DUF362 family)
MVLAALENLSARGDVVLLKPNYNTANPFPASTDFEFLRVMIELVYAAGAKIVLIGDSSTMALNTKKTMKKAGVFELEKLAQPASVFSFDERKWIKKEIPSGKYLKSVLVPEILDKIDKLVLVPCLKTHCLAQFTGALKISVGFMKPSQRVLLHLRHLQEKIAELNKIIHPDLIVMDARKCFVTKGPNEGRLEEPRLVLASTSRVALDIEGVKIIQGFKGNDLRKLKDPKDLPQIKRAIEVGID